MLLLVGLPAYQAENELVLIFGGLDETGQVISEPEVFSGKSVLFTTISCVQRS